MMGSEQYRRQAAVTGMTRVEMLLALYDRAILHLQAAEEAHAKGDAANASLEQFQAQKMIFGLRYTPGWLGFGPFPNRNHTACFFASHRHTCRRRHCCSARSAFMAAINAPHRCQLKSEVGATTIRRICKRHTARGFYRRKIIDIEAGV